MYPQASRKLAANGISGHDSQPIVANRRFPNAAEYRHSTEMTSPSLMNIHDPPESAARLNKGHLLVTVALTCFAIMMLILGLFLRFTYGNHFALTWIFVSAIFAVNATTTSYGIFQEKRRWLPYLVIPASVLLGSALAMLFKTRLFFVFVTLLSLHVPFCWLVTYSLGFPRWAIRAGESHRRGRVSIYGMMSLTLAVAITMTVVKYGDLDRIPPAGVLLLLFSSTTGWLLGCSMFSFTGLRQRFLVMLLLVICCVCLSMAMDTFDLKQSSRDKFHISLTMPVVGFIISTAFGILLFVAGRLNRKPLAAEQNA